ncbi:MAG: riboflavin synthase [Coriobacteriales bacterium]|jgi:riboflavin synthase|nr:riboflavin synthase [Coriobacteriales bacterium]
MFTGIIEEIGVIEATKRAKLSAVLSIKGSLVIDNLQRGDSVAVDGVCLTVSELGAHSFSADVMHETLDHSTLGSLRAGSKVNLERALPAEGRFGGHIVTGHIDACGTITKIVQDDNAVWFTVKTEASLLRTIVQKGSLALNGISLTVARVTDSDFSVSIIPHTLKETTLALKKVGDQVNLETDIIGKYVEKLLTPQNALSSYQQKTGGISQDFLALYGF